MKKVHQIIIVAILVTTYVGCVSKKSISKSKDTNNVVTLKGVGDSFREKEYFLYNQLETNKTSFFNDEWLHISRKLVIKDFGDEYLKSDTIIIVESFCSVLAKYTSSIYSSFDKTIKEYETFNNPNDSFKPIVTKKNKKGDVIISSVINGNLKELIEENSKHKMTPETDYLISMFFKMNGKYEYKFKQTVR